MRISENVNLFRGLKNAVNPSSALYEEGFAFASDNSRIDKEGVWNKGPTLGSAAGAPTVKTVPDKTGKHFASLNILGSHIVAQALGNGDTIAEGSNGYAYTLYSGVPKHWDGNITTGAVGLAVPTSPSASKSGSTGTRMERGLYYYLFIAYNATRDIESLPATVQEHWVDRRYVSDVRVADVPRLKATSTGNTIRIYRSKCIKIEKGDTFQKPQVNLPTRFYFIGEAASATYFNDYAHDSEIDKPENIYTGRGSKPPLTNVDALASFQNRMFYFVDNVAYYSSAGRPEEVGQNYSLSIALTYSEGVWTTGTFKDQLAVGTTATHTMTMKPLLDTGVYAQAVMTIPELAGRTVVAAKEFGGKLWIWTNTTTGYITPTSNYEGFKYVKVADGIGLCSPHTLAESPAGLFGADKKGIWLVTDKPKRLSDGVVDIDDSGKSTYCNSSYLAASWGVWVDLLNEYWWSIQKAATPTYTQIVYQADRGTFAGPYNIALTGGTNYSLGDDSECYLTGGKTPIISSRVGVQTLKFWLGQKNNWAVKDRLKVEVIYNSFTKTGPNDITASIYQNNVASETSAKSSGDYTHTSGNLIGLVEPKNSGRYFEVYLSIPTDVTAPIAGMNYEANIIDKSEKARR